MFTHLEVTSSLGISTSRYCSCIPRGGTEYVIDVPLGACIGRWQMRDQKRTRFFQAHGDAVTVMIRSRRAMTITASYAGEIKLWDDEWKCLGSSRVPAGGIMHGAWDSRGDRFLVVAESEPATAFWYSIRRSAENDNVKSGEIAPSVALEYQFQLEGKCTVTHRPESWISTAEFSSSDNIVVIAEDHSRIRVKPPPKKKEIGIFAALYDRVTGALKFSTESQFFNGTESSVIVGAADGSAVAAVVGRRVLVYSLTDDLKLLNSFDAQGSGPMKSVAFPSIHRLYTPSEGGHAICYELSPASPPRELYRLPFPSDGGSIAFFMGTAGSVLFVCSESGLFALSDHEGDVSRAAQLPVLPPIIRHEMVACGVDFSADGEEVISGDLLGNVLVHRVGDHAAQVRSRTKLSAGVRSVAWRRDATGLAAVGLLDGVIWGWLPQSGKEPYMLAALDGSITALKWRAQRDPNSETTALLAAGSTAGYLAVFAYEEQHPGTEPLRPKLVFKAHRPASGPQDLKFGSLQKFAEVWSVAWSPDGQSLASCSEDQSVRIWSLEGDLLATLLGHTTAVTSIDWQVLPDGKEVLVSCADDQSVRVWAPRTGADDQRLWCLSQVFSSGPHISHWHTITYLAIDALRARVMCATQNGHVLLWDMGESAGASEPLFAGKLHTASIEGLVFHSQKRLLASVSSDCCVNVYKIM